MSIRNVSKWKHCVDSWKYKPEMSGEVEDGEINVRVNAEAI